MLLQAADKTRQDMQQRIRSASHPLSSTPPTNEGLQVAGEIKQFFRQVDITVRQQRSRQR